MTPKQKGKLGGSVSAAESPKKARALRALHASRRGKRQSTPSRERDSVLAEVLASVREPVRGVRSIRVVAAVCGVADSTVRRWLNGTDWPPLTKVRKMSEWLHSLPKP